MNEQEQKTICELANSLENTSNKLFEAEKRLKRLEKMEMMLSLWAKDVHASDNGSALFDDEHSSLFRIGYQEAQLIAARILCDNDCEATEKYKEMLNTFE